MKNLKPCPDDCFSIYKRILSRKNSDTISRLSLIEQALSEAYTLYEHNYNQNSLELTDINSYGETEDKDLKKLYVSSNSEIQKIKNSISYFDGKQISSCPYCTFGEIYSLDHYIPKEPYVDLSVNAKNLFPCCIPCNNKKGSKWLENGKRTFLNLYLDILPEIQYLFVNVVLRDGTFEVTFTLENRNEIDEDLFELITSHYEKLGLLKRFREQSGAVISELINTLNAVPDGSMSLIVNVIQQSIAQDKEMYGFNYWRSTLRDELIINSDFIQYVEAL